MIADLHIHSRFSRATSGDCDAPHLDLAARTKGISLIGTGDFTHPAWRKELEEKLEKEQAEHVKELKANQDTTCATLKEIMNLVDRVSKGEDMEKCKCPKCKCSIAKTLTEEVRMERMSYV